MAGKYDPDGRETRPSALIDFVIMRNVFSNLRNPILTIITFFKFRF